VLAMTSQVITTGCKACGNSTTNIWVACEAQSTRCQNLGQRHPRSTTNVVSSRKKCIKNYTTNIQPAQGYAKVVVKDTQARPHDGIFTTWHKSRWMTRTVANHGTDHKMSALMRPQD
jgi:hypothetical protein